VFSNKSRFVIFIIAMASAIWVDSASAATLGTIAENLKGQLGNIYDFVRYLIIVLGVVSVGTGISGIANAKKTQQPIVPEVLKLITGIAMVAVVSLIGVGTESTDLNSGGDADILK
jgi:hypothetical protein